MQSTGFSQVPVLARRRRCLVALMTAWMAFTVPAWAQGQPPPPTVLTVSVVPQFPAADIARTWGPILTQLSERVGVQFVLRQARDIPGFEAEVLAGTPDVAYLNPFHQLRAWDAQGYVPLLRDAELLTGIVVVRQDSPIRAARELDGHTLAFPAPNAFGASLLTRAQLVEVERIRITPVYARTHTNAYRHTLAGLSTATGGLRATLAREPAEVQAGLRVLMETPGAAPHPLSVHPRVPKALHARLQQAWLQLAQQPELQPSFKAIPMPQPVLADQARDYEPLRRLRLERYAQ